MALSLNEDPLQSFAIVSSGLTLYCYYDIQVSSHYTTEPRSLMAALANYSTRDIHITVLYNIALAFAKMGRLQEGLEHFKSVCRTVEMACKSGGVYLSEWSGRLYAASLFCEEKVQFVRVDSAEERRNVLKRMKTALILSEEALGPTVQVAEMTYDFARYLHHEGMVTESNAQLQECLDRFDGSDAFRFRVRDFMFLISSAGAPAA